MYESVIDSYVYIRIIIYPLAMFVVYKKHNDIKIDQIEEDTWILFRRYNFDYAKQNGTHDEINLGHPSKISCMYYFFGMTKEIIHWEERVLIVSHTRAIQQLSVQMCSK